MRERKVGANDVSECTVPLDGWILMTRSWEEKMKSQIRFIVPNILLTAGTSQLLDTAKFKRWLKQCIVIAKGCWRLITA